MRKNMVLIREYKYWLIASLIILLLALLYMAVNSEMMRRIIDKDKSASAEAPFPGKKTIDNRIFGAAVNGKTICIDAGHGGKDSGATAEDATSEAYLSLDVAIKLRDLLELSGAKVVMTRTTDVFVPLAERAAIANKMNADVFLSIHINTISERSAWDKVRGVQIYYSGVSENYAAALQREILDIIATGDGRLFERRFDVLRRTNMPSALAELGFLSNQCDLALLNNETFRQNAARGLFNGLESYFGGNVRLTEIVLPKSVAIHLASARHDQDAMPSQNN
jgi:N-acetylmuramoyl-L-alanine amidase